MQNFRDLLVWKKAHAFALSVYITTSKFPREEMYNITSQLKRASTSIPANISEGAGRFTSKDFAHFLQIALGSSHESEYFLLLSKDLHYIDSPAYDVLNKDINEIKAMLISLIKKVRA